MSGVTAHRDAAKRELQKHGLNVFVVSFIAATSSGKPILLPATLCDALSMLRKDHRYSDGIKEAAVVLRSTGATSVAASSTGEAASCSGLSRRHDFSWCNTRRSPTHGSSSFDLPPEPLRPTAAPGEGSTLDFFLNLSRSRRRNN